MTNDWLLVADAFSVPFSLNGLNTRIVELTATYLVQSTLFLLVAWAFADIRFVLTGRLRPPSPSSNETVWKLAAALPLLTAPLCVGAGWSHNVIQWSLASHQAIQVAPEDNDDEDASGVYPVEKPRTSHQEFGPVDRASSEEIDRDAVTGILLSSDAITRNSSPDAGTGTSTFPLASMDLTTEPLSIVPSSSPSLPPFESDRVGGMNRDKPAHPQERLWVLLKPRIIIMDDEEETATTGTVK